MSIKPSTLPRWATVPTVNGTTGQTNIIEPPSAKKDLGWDYLEKPARNYMNWLQYTTYQWIEYWSTETDQFAPHESSPQAMTITVDGGRIFANSDVVVKTAQTTGTITAPSVNPRIDRVVINESTGVISVITGAEAASPTAPAIPNGTRPIAQIALTTAHTVIADADITDERALGIEASLLSQDEVVTGQWDFTQTVKGLGGNWLISPDGTDITPQQELHLHYGTDTAISIGFTNIGTGATGVDGTVLRLANTSYNFQIRNYENSNVEFWTDDTFRGKVDAGGNWLISPDGSDIVPQGYLTIYDSNVSGLPSLRFQNGGTGTNAGDGFDISLSAAENVLINNKESTDIEFYTNNAFNMALFSGGNLLLGNAKVTPSAEFVLYNSAVSGNPSILFQNGDTGVTPGDGAFIGLTSGEALEIGSFENNNIQFYTVGAFRAKVDLNGNILISDLNFSPGRELTIYRDSVSGTPSVSFQNQTTGTAINDGFFVGLDSSERPTILNYENTDMMFYTNDSFVGKFGNNGSFLISGTDFSLNRNLVIYGGVSDAVYMQAVNGTTGTLSSDGFLVGIDLNENALLLNQENTDTIFYTSNNFRGKVGAGGGWQISNSDGGTPPALLQIYDGGSADAVAYFQNLTTGTTISDGLKVGIDTSENAQITNYENTDIQFFTNSVFRGKVNSGGSWLIGNSNFSPAHRLVTYDSGLGGTVYHQFVNGDTGVLATDGSIVGIDASEDLWVNNQESQDIVFATNATRRGKIASNGNWLVAPTGTSITPQGELTIYIGSGTATPALQIQNLDTGTTPNDGLELGLDNAEGVRLRNKESTDIQFFTNDTFRGQINSNGYFAISNATFTPNHEVVAYNTGVGSAPRLQTINGDTGTGSSDGFAIGIDGSENAVLINYENTDIDFFTNGVIFRGKISAGGNWLIADSDITPNAELVLYENSASGSPRIAFQNVTTGTASTDGAYVEINSSEVMVIANQENTAMNFATNSSLRFQIAADGGITDGVASSNGAGTIHMTNSIETEGDLVGEGLVVSDGTTGAANVAFIRNRDNGTFTGTLLTLQAYRAATTVYDFLYCYSDSDGSPDAEFRLRGDGSGYADTTWTTPAADFGEYYEWLDGNPDNEDRRGVPVVLEGEFVRPVADEDDTGDIIGVVSVSPGFTGDNHQEYWRGKYLRDVFGEFVRDGKGKKVLNPEYDPKREYIPPEDRLEKVKIGNLGKLPVRKGFKVNPRWRKMKDLSDDVALYQVVPALRERW